MTDKYETIFTIKNAERMYENYKSYEHLYRVDLIKEANRSFKNRQWLFYICVGLYETALLTNK